MSCGAANTQGQIGPNLDDAFGYARKQEFDESTFFEVVLGQMEIPVPPMPDFDEEETDGLHPGGGSDRDRRVRVPVRVDREEHSRRLHRRRRTDRQHRRRDDLQPSCASCHTFEAAGSTGNDRPEPRRFPDRPPEAIEQIRNGGGQMPAFGDQLTDEQIEAVAQYVVENRAG